MSHVLYKLLQPLFFVKSWSLNEQEISFYLAWKKHVEDYFCVTAQTPIRLD